MSGGYVCATCRERLSVDEIEAHNDTHAEPPSVLPVDEYEEVYGEAPSA